jgi:phosphoketolase
MQLRYLKSVDLKKATKTKQPNGTYTETLTLVSSYSVQTQELNDDISVSVYGADLYKITRIKSVNSELEVYLKSKLNNEEDNISKYYIIIDGYQHKIKSVRENWIDIELIGKYEEEQPSV